MRKCFKINFLINIILLVFTITFWFISLISFISNIRIRNRNFQNVYTNINIFGIFMLLLSIGVLVYLVLFIIFVIKSKQKSYFIKKFVSCIFIIIVSGLLTWLISYKIIIKSFDIIRRNAQISLLYK